MDIPAASLMHLICVNTGLKSPSSSPVAALNSSLSISAAAYPRPPSLSFSAASATDSQKAILPALIPFLESVFAMSAEPVSNTNSPGSASSHAPANPQRIMSVGQKLSAASLTRFADFSHPTPATSASHSVPLARVNLHLPPSLHFMGSPKNLKMA